MNDKISTNSNESDAMNIFGMKIVIAVLFLIFTIVLYGLKHPNLGAVFLSVFSIVLGALLNEKRLLKHISEKLPEVLIKKHPWRLSKMGIERVYNKRKGTKKDGYLCDLSKEFERLHKKHKKEKEPIRMIGVALESYFGTPDQGLLSEISSHFKSVYFRVLISKCETHELNKQFELVSEKTKRGRNITQTRLHDFISISLDNLRKYQDSSNEHLTYYSYEFAPYATIIFINEHVYYTPNMTIFSDDPFLLDTEDVSEDIPKNVGNIELSFRIKLKSEFGKKLFEHFEKLWKNEVKKVPKPAIADDTRANVDA